jgi:hypothetical protein
VRALVRDAASGRSGMAAERIEVPRHDRPYVSTLVLTDVVSQRDRGATIVPLARRAFRDVSALYCFFEIYPVSLDSFPEYVSRYTVFDERSRQVIAAAPETRIGVALEGRVSRIYGVVLNGLGPGRYRLEVEATERRSRFLMRASDWFTVEAPAGGN